MALGAMRESWRAEPLPAAIPVIARALGSRGAL
jgi:hypothetical protein